MSADTPHAGPGIRFPPPLVLAVGFVLGMVIHRFFPAAILDGYQGPSANFVLWSFLLAGAVIAAWGMLTFVQSRTPVVPHRAASTLVTHGPYRFSRNPMYVGLTAMYIGLALFVNSAWPLVMLPPALWSLWRLVIRKEEKHLEEVFGDDYRAYKDRVRRWI